MTDKSLLENKMIVHQAWPNSAGCSNILSATVGLVPVWRMLEKHLFRDFKHGMPRVSRRAGQTIRELALKRRTKAVVSF